MAADNTDTQSVQQSAMAEQANVPPAAESSGDGRKNRQSPITSTYQHCLSLIVGLAADPTDKDDKGIAGMIPSWENEAKTARAALATDPTDEAATLLLQDAETAIRVLSALATQITTFRDTPRETAGMGKHYVATKDDGSREHFQAVAVPTAKSYPSYKAVHGPFPVVAGALYQVKNGVNANPKGFRAPTVFSR